MKLEGFLRAVEGLGDTQREQAKKLGITPRRLQQWRRGNLPRLLIALAEHPELAAALASSPPPDPKQSSLAS